MNKSKQATLFQSWGNRNKELGTRADNPVFADNSHGSQCESYPTVDPDVIDLCKTVEEDEDDEFLLEAMDNAETGQNASSSYSSMGHAKYSTVGNKQQDNSGDIFNISIGADILPTQLGSTQDNSLPGFDCVAGKLWIYPTNYPVREYQFSIVKQALFKNTLVVLPTGLGKTFIAAVLMYNLYRWYPQGKVIFMAPTKPLVAQQIEACYKIMGIPQKDTAEMTGNMGPTKREKAWCENRVFFLTPQVMANDLSRGSCPAEKVKCLVVDEAHKALGNHAYCQVVRELVKYTQNFRVLALSATPGSDIKTVQQVVNNLLISQIELRTEDSPDIRQYSHERKVEKIVIPLGDELSSVKATYIQIMEVFVSRLKRQGVLYNRDTTSLSKFLILKARESFRQNPPEKLPRQHYGAVEGDFALAMSLYHGFELLQLHGARSLYNFLDGIVNGEKGYGRTRAELMRNSDFSDLMEMLAQKFTPAPSQSSSVSSSASKEKKPFVSGHPKMEKLQEIVLDHFKNFANDENIKKGVATRIMIFSQYRDSVQEITDMLNRHYPLVKVMSFIGQSSAGKSTKGFTQKEQLKVMKKFREGGYNTLVSTCVGEEGLDIGEVDLIICFDANKSPIRLVQRMGRTGRKREGRIVMLMTQGKEEQIYNQSQYSKRSIHKAILNGAKSLQFYQFSPLIVPDNTAPNCHKMHITIKEEFKPTRKLSADRDHCTNSVIGKKTVAPLEEILTREEYKELVSEWGLPLDHVRKMPKSLDIICLSAALQEDMVKKENDSCRELSLTEWLPWQNQLQPTHLIEHSLASKHLVQLMEFIEIQQTLNPEDDNYGLEMAAYLDEDDILKPGETKSSTGLITKFCVPLSENTEIDTRQHRRKRRNSTDVTYFHEDCEVNSEQVCNRKTKKSKTDLPDLEIQQVEILPDEELPPFDLNFNNQNNSGMSEKRSGVLDENRFHEDSKEGQDNLKPADKCPSSDASVNQMKCAPQEVNSDDKETLPLVMQKYYERRKTESDLLRKKRKAVKKDYTKVRQSVVEVIADMDDHDFDLSEKNEFENSDQLIPISNPGNGCERIVFSNTDELSNINSDVEDENIIRLFKLFPVLRGVRQNNNHKLHGQKGNDKAGSMFRVRSPPSVVDMVETLNAPDIEHEMICLDITQIAEEWEKENQINHTGEMNSGHDLEKCEHNFEKSKKGSAELSSDCQKQFSSSKSIHAHFDSFKNKSENSHANNISKSLVNDLAIYAGVKEQLKKPSEKFEQGPTDVLKNGISDSNFFTVHSEESISLQGAININKHDTEGYVLTPFGNPENKEDSGSPKNIKQGNIDRCKVGAKTSVNSEQQPSSICRDDANIRHQKASVLNSQVPTNVSSLLNADKKDKEIMFISESHKDSDDSDIDELLFLCLEKSRKSISASCAKNCTSLGKRSRVISSLKHGHPSHKDSTDKLEDVIDIIPLNQRIDSCTENEIISASFKSLKSRISSKFDKSVCEFPDGDSRSRQNQTWNVVQGDTSSFVLNKDLHMPGYSPSLGSRSELHYRTNARDENPQQPCSEDSNTKIQTKLMLPLCDTQVIIKHDKLDLEQDRSRIVSCQLERNKSFNETFGDDFDFAGLEAIEASLANKDTSIQFTFTQAFDCVNNSLELSTEPTDTCSRDGHRKGKAASVSKQKAVDANFNEPDRSDSRVVNSVSAQLMQASEKNMESLPSKERHTAKEKTDYQNPSHAANMGKNTVNNGPTTSGFSNSDDEDYIEFPEFDLGFDLDEDIVPPSPCSTQFSQSSFSSQKSFYSRRSLKFSAKEETFSKNSCNVSSDSQIQIVEHKKSSLNSIEENKNDDVFIAIRRKDNNNQTGKDHLESVMEASFDSEKKQNMKNTGNEDKLGRKSFNYTENGKSSNIEERQNINGFGSEKKQEKMDQDMEDEQKMACFNSEALKRHNTGNVAEGKVAIGSCAGSDMTNMNITSKLDRMGKGSSMEYEVTSKMQTITKTFIIEDESKEDCNFQEEEVVFETSFSLQYEDDLLKDLVETEDQIIAKCVGQDKPNTQSSQSTTFGNLVSTVDSHDPHSVENTNGEEPDKCVENDPDMQNISMPNDSDMDNSFVVVGKKRKLVILSSPESPDYSSKVRRTDSGNLDCQFKTPLRPPLSLPRGKSSIMDTDSKNTKSSKACLSFDMTNLQNEDEDKDFEDSSMWFSKQAENKIVQEPKRLIKRSVKIKSDIKKEVNSCMATKDRKRKRKCRFRSNPFIEDEAEVSEEDMANVSEDEADHSELDDLDESFINDATQMSQTQAVDVSDMYAVYLKSIRSPIHHPERGRFKLQNHYHRRNVFSQVPEEEESQYMEDSFCVADEDVEEVSLVSEDDEEAEIKILKEISPQRRRPTRKSKMENFKAKLKTRKKTNIRWIRALVDSSSSDEVNHKKEDGPNINSSNEEFSRTSEIKKASSLPSSDDEKDFCDNTKLNSSTKKNISKNKTDVHDGCKESICAKNINPVVKDIYCKTTEELRQERIKRQKEKQEEFRRKTAEKAGLQNNKFGHDLKDNEHCEVEEEMTKLKSKNTCMIVENVTQLHENEQNIIIPELNEEQDSMDMMTDINKSKSAKKCVLLVDSREISGAQDIVSSLRFQHSIHVCAFQLPGCDYIVSNRMAVDRKQWSEFSNGSNRVKFIKRMQYFAELYDQPCLVLESDRIKLGDEKSQRPIHWTKYIDKTLSQLINSNIRLYFTSNQIETAALLAELCQLEQRKNMAITVPLELNSQQQSVAKFLCTVPKLGYIHVLNLCNGFRTLSDLVGSSVMSIEKKGQISQSRATEVYRYIRRTFDSNMLPVN